MEREEITTGERNDEGDVRTLSAPVKLGPISTNIADQTVDIVALQLIIALTSRQFDVVARGQPRTLPPLINSVPRLLRGLTP